MLGHQPYKIQLNLFLLAARRALARTTRPTASPASPAQSGPPHHQTPIPIPIPMPDLRTAASTTQQPPMHSCNFFTPARSPF
ncbi:hypothetical protein GGTG_03910 [Gaeumannomyces tritici R3-111a-1]|uniref:Uncharacterized protein n=1 Tax=Gaeumannomyces tritici (strain R3-111a-1) TaxID=644352 RepID=J3NRK7_GAET3|nr:hypothetical protein GGTG_03910 [Gaeumannomyces tritici R3-111a-1]EJT78813.1 hypothetical protein GGTG_03910 [Gaeumannomyces tritici R3-111a-1]